MSKAGFEVPGEWRDGYEAFIEVLQTDEQLRDVYEELITRSVAMIVQEEASYFGDIVDQAKERERYK